VTHTPAVGVRAGRIGGRSTSLNWGWPSALRSALPPTLVVALVLAVGGLAVAPRPVAALTDSLDLSATYNVAAEINWAEGSLTVSSTAHVTNSTPNTVDRLTFNLLPLRLGRIQFGEILAGGAPAYAVASDQSVVVALAAPLGPTEETHVTIDYKAFFNTSTSGKKALFMKKNGTAAAYRWIPWLSREQRFKTPNFGETWVTGVSPHVSVTFTSDVPLTIATSGTGGTEAGGTQAGGQPAEGLRQTFEASWVRDFNFAASPDFKVRSEEWNGISVDIFYRVTSPSRLWNWTRRAMERFSSELGPYPYSHLSVVETPAGVGMESPGMTWVDATLPKSTFPYIVVHETAHQWFYAVIGNNQAADPFVDEALADFLTRDLLGNFRRSTCPDDRLDKTVYEYVGRCYPEVIYVQGGLYLKAYMDEVGREVFWAGMQQFYRDRAFGLSGTHALLDHLDAASGFDSTRHATRFPSLFQ
jgi:hypothetical protein